MILIFISFMLKTFERGRLFFMTSEKRGGLFLLLWVLILAARSGWLIHALWQKVGLAAAIVGMCLYAYRPLPQPGYP
jgi:hypothetical protein